MKLYILKESPDTVWDENGDAFVQCWNAPNIPFIIYKNNNTKQVKYIAGDGYKTGEAQSHSSLRSILRKNGETDYTEIIQGRIWPEKNVASVYQLERETLKYGKQVEAIFDEAGLDITKFTWDFSDVEYEDSPKWKKSNKSGNVEIDDATRKQINDLILQMHVAPPDKKINLRYQIQQLQKLAGIPDDELEQTVRDLYMKSVAAKRQGEFGSIDQANYAKGSIAEVKFRIYNDKMDSSLWEEDMTIKPEIRTNLLKIAQDFYKSTDLKTGVLNILLIGSTANYNWTPTSDMDLHIVIDVTKENIPTEHARAFLDGLAAKWNNNHEIEVKGHPVEVYLQDVKEKNSTAELAREGAAVYSILKNEWVKKPVYGKPSVDVDKIKQKFNKIKSMISEFISDKNIDKLKMLMKSIRTYRDTGLGENGEFSTENLVFKALRRTGELKKLKDSINSIYDSSVSIKENLK